MRPRDLVHRRTCAAAAKAGHVGILGTVALPPLPRTSISVYWVTEGEAVAEEGGDLDLGSPGLCGIGERRECRDLSRGEERKEGKGGGDEGWWQRWGVEGRRRRGLVAAG